MRNNKAQKAVRMMVLAIGLIGLVAATSPVLLAHDQHGRNAYNEGAQIGYQYGFQHGQNDSHARAGYDFRSREFRLAMFGYDRRFGSLRDYRQGFRAGYESGYNQGYSSRREHRGRHRGDRGDSGHRRW